MDEPYRTTVEQAAVAAWRRYEDARLMNEELVRSPMSTPARREAAQRVIQSCRTTWLAELDTLVEMPT